MGANASATIVLALLGGLLGAGCTDTNPHSDPEPELGRLKTIAFAGDTMLARRLNEFVERQGPQKSLAGVREILQGADISVVNLECIIASGGEPADKDERNSFYYRGRPELVRVLTEAGVDVASLANNHAGDYGPAAVVEGVELLRAAGVEPLGAGANIEEAMAPVFRKVGDIVVGFVAMDMTQRKVAATPTRAGPHIVLEEREDEVVQRVREQVQLARRYAHLVFFVTHWGGNYDEEPSDRHRQLARRLVREAEIDGLLGSSAHQFQGLEVVDGRPILYDAGDLLFDFASDNWTHKTAIFVLHFDRSGVRWLEAIPVRMGDSTAKVADGADRAAILTRLDDLSQRLGTKLWLANGRARLGLGRVNPRRPPRETYVPPPRQIVLPRAGGRRPANVVVNALPASATPLKVAYAEGIELLGYELPAKVGHRTGLRITTYWRATKRLNRSFKIFTHVEPLDTSRRPRWNGDHEPGDWAYPTDWWRPGEIVRDSYQTRPPGNSKRGRHEVLIGLFAPERLHPLDREHVDDRQRIKLGVVDVSN